jgi:dienelactone hydrolase
VHAQGRRQAQALRQRGPHGAQHLPGAAHRGQALGPAALLRQARRLAALAAEAALQPALPLLLLGLSSGGHLAGTLACQGEPVRAAHARGVLIGYAPLNANHRRYKAPAGKPDYPPPEKQAFYDAWPIGLAPEPHGLPPLPVFISCALHDAVVPVDHTLNLVRGLQQAGGDVEAHIFPQAPHGYALRDKTGSHAHWPEMAARWLQRVLQSAP